jgi:hypothetical protein
MSTQSLNVGAPPTDPPDPRMTVPVPPLYDIWSTLLERWLALPVTDDFRDMRRPPERAAHGKRTKTALTSHMNAALGEHYTPQAVSQWATGSDERNPPWRAILFLLRELKLDLVLSGDGRAWFVQARAKK